MVKRLEQTDSSASQWVDLQNPARVIRSIELVETTGKSLEQLRQSADTPPNPIAYSWGCFAIDLPRETLYNRINLRVDQMILDGFLGEAKALFEFRASTALKTVGYSELFDFFEGKFELDSAIDLIKQKTRNYAKRQITWFNHHLNTQWINP